MTMACINVSYTQYICMHVKSTEQNLSMFVSQFHLCRLEYVIEKQSM